MNWKHTCAVCYKDFNSLSLLKNHVEQHHRSVEFNSEIKINYISDATITYLGPAQPPCWMDEEDEYIDELGRVFGNDSAEAWCGGYQNRPNGVDPKTYYEALIRACGLCDDDDKIIYDAAALVDPSRR